MDNALLLSRDEFTDKPLHDLRAIHDMISLRFDQLQKSSNGAWVVMKIASAPYSGSFTEIGAYIESGQLIDESTAGVVQPGSRSVGIIEEGSWELIDTLDHFTGPNEGQYRWTEKATIIRRRLEAITLYSPFAKGGNVLCFHNPAAQGTAQFESVHLIPQGWETAVRPAYEAFKQSSHLFKTPSLPSHYAELLGMLHGDNSVIAVMAFRTLAENRKIDVSSLKDALGQSEGYRQAAFVYLMLVLPGLLNRKALLSELSTVIGTASAPEERRPIAIAVAAAKLLHPDLPMPQSLAPKVLTALRHQVARRAARTAADPYLRVIFEIMGVSVS